MRRLKKYESGEGSHYITRRRALRKLQLSINDFRRLCIIKGIYPREPKHRRKAQRGSTDIKILYHAKDIKFLLHEPIVWTLRDYKIFNRRTNRDRAIKDFQNLNRRLSLYPQLKIDHIVKERYPTFIDAIKDLDDCLTLLFLFSTFPSLKFVPRDQSALCRRLTIEFMYAMIASKALRKVFISIKGYYFQAEIKGQKVTWILPHYYPFQPQSKSEVDFKVMSIFVEFYTIMLGFVNFRLYHALNLKYPPTLSAIAADQNDSILTNEQTFVSERIAALNLDILRLDQSTMNDGGDNDDNDADEIDLELLTNDSDSKKVKNMKQEALEIKKLKVLFKGLKVFINREVPREPLVFIIRCFGGTVSWDNILFPGATFQETDETITHQIVDRPQLTKQYISRDYIQPQWIFDCVNQRTLLPTNKYFIGAILPAHLSPFVDSKREAVYIPPEEKALRDPSLIETHVPSDADDDDNDDDENKDKEENNKKPDKEDIMNEEELDAQLEKAYKLEQQLVDSDGMEGDEDIDFSTDDDGDDVDVNDNQDADKDAVDDDDDENADGKKIKENKQSANGKEKEREKKKNEMTVQAGKLHKENSRDRKKIEIEEHRLKARMVKPRHRQLFRKLIRDEQSQKKEKWLLEKKRKKIEVDNKELKKKRKREIREKTLAE